MNIEASQIGGVSTLPASRFGGMVSRQSSTKSFRRSLQSTLQQDEDFSSSLFGNSCESNKLMGSLTNSSKRDNGRDIGGGNSSLEHVFGDLLLEHTTHESASSR